jgi:hypothetical protein
MLLEAISRGELSLNGFRNRDLRPLLAPRYATTPSKPCSRNKSWRTTSQLPRCRGNAPPATPQARRDAAYGTAGESLPTRPRPDNASPLFRLHPNAPAIRFVPQPSLCNRTTAATSSGTSILSPHGSNPRGELCSSNISVIPPPSGGVSSDVVRGSVFHVARHPGNGAVPWHWLLASEIT